MYELLKLGEKLNFPTLSMQQVSVKVRKLITGNKGVNSVKKNLKNPFGITKAKRIWLSKKDKDLYWEQVESRIWRQARYHHQEARVGEMTFSSFLNSIKVIIYYQR